MRKFLLVLTLFWQGGLLSYADSVSGWITVFGDTGFSSGSEATASPVTTDADQDSIMAAIPATTLADGESIRVTGSVIINNTFLQGQFRVGLFNGPDPIVAGDGSGYEGFFIYSNAYFRNLGATNPFSTTTGTPTNLGALTVSGSNPSSGTEVSYSMTLTRDGSNLDLEGSFSTVAGYSAQITLNGIDVVDASTFVFDSVGFLMGGSLNASQAQFSDIDVSVFTGTPPDPTPDPEDEPTDPGVAHDFDSATRLFGVDFNNSDALSAPSQSRFRIVAGSSDSAQNVASYQKSIGSYAVTVSQPDSNAFEFIGANDDATRDIPGGDISRSYLVSDFIGTSNGVLEIRISGLPAGSYLFRSFHLDTFNGSGFGYAQGADVNSQNIILAKINDVLLDLVKPTVLGSSGLNTTFIDNSNVPTIGLSFTHDGIGEAVIELSGFYTNGTNNYVFLNGFELFELAP